LKFLYCDEIQLDEKLALNLLAIADRYVQNDLLYKCMDFLKYNTNTNNVYTILDFARQENISHLKEWCETFLKNKMNATNISGLVEYLNKQNNPENIGLRDIAFSVLTKNLLEIPQDKKISPTFYEDFLIRNIALDTVLILVNFISGHNYKRKAPSYEKRSKGFSGQSDNQVDDFIDEGQAAKEKEKLEPKTKNLRTALNNFVWANLKALKESRTAKEFPSSFLVGLLGVVIETQKEQ